MNHLGKFFRARRIEKGMSLRRLAGAVTLMIWSSGDWAAPTHLWSSLTNTFTTQFLYVPFQDRVARS